MTRFLAVLVLLIQLAVTNMALASVDRQFTIAVLAFRDKETVSIRWQPLENLLNKKSENTIFKVKPMYYAELEQAVANRSIDYVLCNPSFYIYLQELYGLSSPLLTLLNKDRYTSLKAFGGVIFTKANNTKINSLDDISGATTAIVSSHSLGGYQMQAYEIDQYQKGLLSDLQFIELGMPHDNAVDAVLSGKADLGFVRTGILEKLEEEGRLLSIESDLKIINKQNIPAFPLITSTKLYPEWPLSSLPNSDQQTTKLLASILLNISAQDPVAQKVSIGGFDIPENYTSVAKLMRSQRLPPFDQVRDVSIKDVWGNYRITLIITMGFIVALVCSYIAMSRLSGQLYKARKQIELDKKTLTEIIWATQIGTWTWNVKTSEVIFNERWASMLGYTLSELQPITFDTWRSLVHPDDSATAQASLQEHMIGNKEYYQHEVRMLHKDGHWVWVLTKAKVVECDDLGNPIRVSGTHTDISERKTLEAEKAAHSRQLEVLATKDSMTNLYNRRYFMESSERLFEISHRYDQPLSFLMIDVDDFKKINDTYGHNYGDKVLVLIAEILKANIRHADILARIGGEEFAILMPNTDIKEAYVIADRITEIMKQQEIDCYGRSIKFSVSIGIAQKEQETNTVSELMVFADKALYQVKNGGKGFAVIYQT